MPDTEVVQHQLAQQELEEQAALSYEEYLRRLTQAVDTEVICFARRVAVVTLSRDSMKRRMS